MKILVVGNGGRENALVWKIAESKRVEKTYVAPGNPGTNGIAQNVNIDIMDIEGLVKFAKKEDIDLTFVGPEAPLVAGIVNKFKKEGLRIFGPDKEAACLEGSKVFSKDLMQKYGIPTAEYRVFSDVEEAISYIQQKGAPLVVKAEGLAAGKGVIVAQSVEEAVKAVRTIIVEEQFGEAGQRVVIEEFLAGEEATILAFVDGTTVIPMLPSQDHKPAFDGDKGPNTGGMGAYAPAPIVDEVMMQKIYNLILVPTIEALKKEGIEYQGVLYCGLMIDKGQAKVLEYNVRFGDPETQVILPLLETDIADIAEAVIDGKLADLEIKWSSDKALCVVMASGGYPVDYEKGKIITGIDKVIGKDLMVFQAGTEERNKKLYTAGGRVLAVTALASDYHSAIDKAYKAVNKINFKGAHYRRDIGHKAL